MKYTKTVMLVMLMAAGVGCGYSKPSMAAATPMIRQLNPASVTAGSGQFQLEVDGTNFAGGAVINFNGVAQATTHTSSTTLEAMIPASAIMHAGPAPVTVTNPATGGVYGMGAITSTPMTFTIN